MSIENEPDGDKMAGHNTIKPALLTRAELDYLLGKPLEAKMIAKCRYLIKQKLRTFLELELPLLRKVSETWGDLHLLLKEAFGAGDASSNLARATNTELTFSLPCLRE